MIVEDYRICKIDIMPFNNRTKAEALLADLIPLMRRHFTARWTGQKSLKKIRAVGQGLGQHHDWKMWLT